MANGTPSRGFWRFIIWISVLSLLLLAVLWHWYTYEKTPPPNPNTPELKALRNEVKSLKKEVAKEKGNASEAWTEVDRLKQYQVTLLDSIVILQKVNPAVVAPPPPARGRPKVKKTTAVCNCPTAFGYYRNRGTGAKLTKKYCKIHG